MVKHKETNKIVTEQFIVKGTSCSSCEKNVRRQALKVVGVKEVSFDLSSEIGLVTYDATKTDIDEILTSIEEKNFTCYIYKPSKKEKTSNFNWVFIIMGSLLVGYFILKLVNRFDMPELTSSMSLGLLFAVGLLTGFHCISMCGGFVLSYTTKDAQAKKKPHNSHLLYAIGKTLSYTIIGALFGLFGSIIAFTPKIRAVVGIMAGLFLVLYGIKMLRIIPALSKFHLSSPRFITRLVGKKNANSGPFMIGLLNGLMIACGPLQAIYIMAAGTGSMIEGAKLLLVFGIGTLPPLIGFGYFASFVSGKVTSKILKASGVIVVVLGLIMINNGLVLSGSGYDVNSVVNKATLTGSPLSNPNEDNQPVEKVEVTDGFQEIRMKVTRSGWEPNQFVLKKDVPVKWIIDGAEITGCNNAIQVPAYGLEFKVQKGEQVIEFTPDKEGVISWSCWMGMIPGTFIVKEDIDVSNQAEVESELAKVPAPKASGGCGCGG